MFADKQQGMSLIELLTVVAILGILAAIMTVSFRSYFLRTKAAAAKQSVVVTERNVADWIHNEAEFATQNIQFLIEKAPGINTFSYTDDSEYASAAAEGFINAARLPSHEHYYVRANVYRCSGEHYCSSVVIFNCLTAQLNPDLTLEPDVGARNYYSYQYDDSNNSNHILEFSAGPSFASTLGCDSVL